MSFAIFVDFGAGYTDIAQHCRALTKTQRLHSDLAPCVNTCSFIVDDPTTANLFLTSATYLPMYVEKDAVAWFVGLVRPTYGAQVSANLDSLSVECVDKSITLQKKIGTSLYYNGYAVCDPSTKAASILHQLFYAAGFADAELDLSLINETITTYAQASSDGASYWDALAELCFEYGYGFDLGDDGIVRLTDLYPTTYTPGLIEDRDIYHSMTIDRQETQTEAVRVTWHPTVTLDNRVVFEDTTGSDGTTGCKIDVAATGYYPEGAGTGDVYCEYQLDGYEILTVLSAELLFNANGVVEDTFTPGYKRALLKLYSATGGTITQLRIRGNAICRDQNTIYRSVRYNVPASEKVLDVEAKWLSTSTQAQRLSSGLASWYDFADFVYSWPADEALTLGGVYTLEDEVLDISTDVRIVEVKEDEWGELRVTAEGMSAYTVGAVSRDDAVGVAPATGAAKTASEPTYAYDGLGALPYENWDSIPVGSELFDLRQPDCKSSTMREPTSKEIVFLPGKLRDELGTEYDNLWSRFAGLGTIGVFKATTNQVTDPEDMTVAGWTKSAGCTATASAHYWRGRRFTTVTSDGGGDSRMVSRSVGTITGTVAAVRATMRRVDSTTSGFGLAQPGVAWRALIAVTWATKAIAVIAGSATVVEANWYDSDQVLELSLAVTGISTGTAHDVICFATHPTTEAKSTDFTAVQVEASAYPTPYTPTSRAAGALVYPYSWPTAYSIEGWIRPWFSYADGLVHIIYKDDNGAGTYKDLLYYNGATSKWTVVMGGTATAVSAAQTSNADVQKWLYVKVWHDTVGGDGGIIIMDEAAATIWSTTWSGKTGTPYSLLAIGMSIEAAGYWGDIQFADFLLRPTADVSTAHYDRGVPWFDPSERTNATQSVRINRSGIRMHNAGLTITDDYNRLIDVSNRTGLLVRDAGGAIVHDLPNAPMLTGVRYGGHLVQTVGPVATVSVNVTYTDVVQNRAAWSATQNTALATQFPSNITNLKAVLVGAVLSQTIAAAKIAVGTRMAAWGCYSTTYNDTFAGTYSMFVEHMIKSQVATVAAWDEIGNMAILPVTYDAAGAAYITWVLYFYPQDMTTANANYQATLQLRLLGGFA